jgi:hypothetical protein
MLNFNLVDAGSVISLNLKNTGSLSDARFIVCKHNEGFNLMYIGNTEMVFPKKSEDLEELKENIIEKFNPDNIKYVGNLMQAIEDGLDHCTGYRYLADKLSKDVVSVVYNYLAREQCTDDPEHELKLMKNNDNLIDN